MIFCSRHRPEYRYRVRDEILSEIRRLAEQANGRAPGRRTFEAATGIRAAEWLGVHWARWGDAILEAGLTPNQRQGKADRQLLLESAAAAVRHFGRLPTTAELRLYGKARPGFPSHGTFNNHFKTQAGLAAALRAWASEHTAHSDILNLVPAPLSVQSTRPTRATRSTEGLVYLLRSGDFYKIGRSDDLERRVKEIRVALPDKTTLVHSIRTDDPAGIEAYWHRRFAAQRANGEWFRLSPTDVSAFRKRRFQ